MATSKAQELVDSLSAPPVETSLQEPDAAQLLFDTEEPPPFPEMNIFPLEWRVETPKLQQIYDASRVPGWSPHTLPWDTLDPEAFSNEPATPKLRSTWRSWPGCGRVPRSARS